MRTLAARAGWAWLGIAGPAAYVAAWAVLGATRAGYDPVRDAISELAEVGAGTAPLMSAGFVGFGAMGVVFALLVLPRLPGAGLALQAAMLSTSAATIGAAVFPCTPGCPGPGAGGSDLGHAVMATIGYAALIACPLLAARALHDAAQPWRGFARWSLACGVLSGLGLLAWAFGLAGEAAGLAQRGFNTLADLWWATLALVLLRRGGGAGGVGPGRSRGCRQRRAARPARRLMRRAG